jgi:hybrid cluster-associated redox disulfide protein
MEEKKQPDNQQTQGITKDMIIEEIVEKYPYLAEYIMDYGVHCVGCGVASFESLKEGFMGHGMGEEEIDAIVAELNKVIEEKEKNK